MSKNKKVIKFKINSYFDFLYMSEILRKYNILLFAQHPKLGESEIPNFNLSTTDNYIFFRNNWMRTFFSKEMYLYVKNYNFVMLLNNKDDLLLVKKKLEENNFLISGYFFNENNTFFFVEDLKFEFMKKEKIYFILKQQKNYRIFLYKKLLLLLKII